MSTHAPGFQSVFLTFCFIISVGQLATSSIRVNFYRIKGCTHGFLQLALVCLDSRGERGDGVAQFCHHPAVILSLDSDLDQSALGLAGMSGKILVAALLSFKLSLQIAKLDNNEH